MSTVKPNVSSQHCSATSLRQINVKVSGHFHVDALLGHVKMAFKLAVHHQDMTRMSLTKESSIDQDQQSKTQVNPSPLIAGRPPLIAGRPPLVVE